MASTSRKGPRQEPVRTAIVTGRELPKGLPKNVTVGWRFVHCAGYDEDPDTGERFYHHFSGKICDCPPGPQVHALLSTAREVACGGGRGSGKSEIGFPFTVRGNPGLDPSNPINVTYLNYSQYKALILRKNLDDLRDWWQRALVFYRQFNATFVEKPYTIRFPGGPIFWASHLEDQDSWQKYQGGELHTIWIEEATQIPNEDTYLRLQGSCRAVHPLIKARIFLTANPGGPGNGWFRRRFWNLKTASGKPIRKGELWVPPDAKTPEEKTLTRTFVYSTIHDNPFFLQHNPVYLAWLKSLKGVLYRQWYEGDFDAFEGQYFDNWNEQKHVVPDGGIQVRDWYHRWMGMDYGTRHATVVYSAALLPDGRVYVYDELVMKGMTPEQVGESIGISKLPEFKRLSGRTIPLYMPPEVIDGGALNAGGRSIGSQIKAGIEKVLGPHSVLLPGNEDPAEWRARLQQQQQAHVIVRSAFNKRVEGWRYMHDLMRTEPTESEKEFSLDFDFAAKLIRESRHDEYNAYITQRRPAAVLPRLIWSSRCRLAIEAIPTAVYVGEERATLKGLNSEDVLKQATDLDDALDGSRYTVNAHRGFDQTQPYEEFRDENLEEILKQYPQAAGSGDRLVWINRRLEQRYQEERKSKGGFYLRRAGSRISTGQVIPAR